jgi:hypothetical protein
MNCKTIRSDSSKADPISVVLDIGISIISKYVRVRILLIYLESVFIYNLRPGEFEKIKYKQTCILNKK